MLSRWMILKKLQSWLQRLFLKKIQNDMPTFSEHVDGFKGIQQKFMG